MLASSHTEGNKQSEDLDKQDKSYYSSPPTVSLPKGGGAIQGMGEKFAANPVTGTGSLSVPIFATPGRSGFSPQLSLSYDSGAGNGAFGMGWNLAAPSITRKTQKGLPQYRDAEESDVFILSGAEDLVPALRQEGEHWVKDSRPSVTVDGTTPHSTSYSKPGSYKVQRYRPRIEGLFARIERWQHEAGDVHWRSLTKDNVTSVYGKDLSSRIVDPTDSSRVFEWLLCESFDDKGNVILYQYKQETSDNVDPLQPQERNRLANRRSYTNQYLKRILYGNRRPFQRDNWLFQVVFDYGEHGLDDPRLDESDRDPLPLDELIRLDQPTPEEHPRGWNHRPDAFSSFRSCFEIRTQRLCRRVLMFHRFNEAGQINEATETWHLVRSTDFRYEKNPVATYLTAVTQTGYREREPGRYFRKSLPPLEFSYSRAQIDGDVRLVDADSMQNLPAGLDGAHYQWVDLDSEGLSGVLTEQANGWFYKRNLSHFQLSIPGDRTAPPEPARLTTAQFAPVELVAAKPSVANLQSGQQQLMDLAGDGQTCLVQFAKPLPGYQEHSPKGEWEPFTPFLLNPNVDWNDPNLKFIDLDGDGRADILIAQDEVFTWYPSLAREGFGASAQVRQPLDDEQGPRLVFADGTQSIYLADMDGDGLTDIVRIQNGSVCYWPNMGYGRFGAKVTMANAPWFDYPDQFNQKRIRLADIDGSGTTDILYLGRNKVSVWFNQSGNAWSPSQGVTFPNVDDLATVQVADLLGNGTACLFWSSPLAKDAQQPMRYIDLMGGQKPHLLVSMQNNLGLEQRLEYVASTRFYLEDRLAGTPWITKLPFPVHVLARVEVRDRVTDTKFVTLYRYHHGYYDRAEREFRGFGMVEQWDTEYFSRFAGSGLFTELPAVEGEEFHQPPVYTKTWFHTGAYIDREHISTFFAETEYYREPQRIPPNATEADRQAIETSFKATLLPDTILPSGLTAQAEQEAARSLKGMVLRQEVYALDGTARQSHPYSVTESNYEIRLVQPLETERHAVFFTFPRESISFAYERNPDDPRIGHQMTLEVDEFGNVLKSVAIVYPRRTPDPELSPQMQAVQARTFITYTENQVANRPNGDPDNPNWYRLGVPIETRAYEITGLAVARLPEFVPFGLEWLRAQIANATSIDYEAIATTGIQKRLIEQVRALYRPNEQANRTDPVCLPLGAIESLALPCESLKIAFTPGLLTQVYGDKLSATELNDLLREDGKYVEQDGLWWIPSGRQAFDPAQFYLPTAMKDPFGHTSTMSYEYALLVNQTTDPIGNTIIVENDYRVMQPKQITDPNGNRSQVRFDVLGMVVGTAVMGKESQNLGDSFEIFEADLTTDEIQTFFDATDSHPLALQHLGTATTRILYALDRVPVCAAAIARETHVNKLREGEQTKVQLSFGYSDGMGREVLKKVQAEPGIVEQFDDSGNRTEVNTGAKVRWVGTGRTAFDNKGKPIKQYEPYFSLAPHYETDDRLVRSGVTPILRYDPLGRLIRTDLPDGTFSKVEFTPWEQKTWDQNDTVLESLWYGENQANADAAKARAARLAAEHVNTPAIAHLDTLGRTFLTIADNGSRGQYQTVVELDIEGNQRSVTDARGNRVMEYRYDLLGHVIFSRSMDAGDRWMLNNVVGKPIRSWDSRDHQIRHAYDSLQRPTHLWVQQGTSQFLAERVVYGEAHPEADARNLRGQVFQHYDGAGVVSSWDFDFKGNLLRSSRQLASEYRQVVDWAVLAELTTVPQMIAASQSRLAWRVFDSGTTYNALNRPILLTSPDNSRIRPVFNEANLLEQVHVRLRGRAEETTFVANIDYDEKGQRNAIDYRIRDDEGGFNRVQTTYDYDRTTFRLIHLRTVRQTDRTLLQDLYYTYDPVGNITDIRDEAQQTVFFQNDVVSPSTQYAYDALYRLTWAQGREHVGQNANAQPDDTEIPRMNIPHVNDAQAMRRYRESYEYDSVGNILRMAHSAMEGSSTTSNGWTRRYDNEANNNRLRATSLPGDETNQFSARYEYDAHGNMIQMPHLRLMQWDFKDQLHASSKQVREDGGTPEITYYVYDASGQRVRKVTERQADPGKEPSPMKERIYLGGFELYREYNGDGKTVTLERETLHVMDDQKRIALAETKTVDSDEGGSITSPASVIRYQFSNHLGSASLELDDRGNVISYEEYHPYGTTSYHAASGVAEVSLKRYRYTGMDRDEETGLNYHTARYYLPWLGRWCSADPSSLVDGSNLYRYSRNNPINLIDPNGTESISIPGPEEYRGREHEAEARAFFEREYVVEGLEWSDKENRWLVWGRSRTALILSDQSFSDLGMRVRGSTADVQPVPLNESQDPNSVQGVPITDDLLAGLEEGDDPIAGLEGIPTDLEEGSRGEFPSRPSRNGSYFGREGGAPEGGLLSGGESGTEPADTMDEIIAGAGILNQDFIGYNPKDPKANEHGVPSGSLGLIDFGALNEYLYLGQTAISILAPALGAIAPYLRRAEKALLRSQARRVWQKLTGNSLDGMWQIHHRIPLEYSHYFPLHPNHRSNLAAVPNYAHEWITDAWGSFRQKHGSLPSREAIVNFADEIDQAFEKYMVYLP